MIINYFESPHLQRRNDRKAFIAPIKGDIFKKSVIVEQKI